jgi:CRP/FNR family cyclic AMP-dependent transcriptional regulator
MLAARQLEIVENCDKRVYRPRRLSGNLSSEFLNRLAALAIPAYHPKGTVLFVEGEPSRGVFILCSGRVKLFTSSAGGKTMILRFAHPGEILGLAGTLTGEGYEAWGEATQRTQTRFVERNRLVDLMRRDGELAVQIAMQLGESYRSAIAGVRAMALSRSADQKVAIFLLDWCESNRPFPEEAVARFIVTHEEIAQVIGTSRETVTRVLSGFKRKGLIRWKGGNLVLTDRPALENSAAS